MTKLRGTIDCDGFPRGTIECRAHPGDLATVRLRNKDFDQCFVVGVVTEAADDGHVKTVATARRRPSWIYDEQCHVGGQAELSKITELTAEQIAIAVPQAFKTFVEASAAIYALLRKPSEP